MGDGMKTSKPRKNVTDLKDVENVWDVLALAINNWWKIVVWFVVAGAIISGYSFSCKWFQCNKAPIPIEMRGK